MTVSVRPATPADLEAVAQVYTQGRPGNPATAATLAAGDEAQAQAGALHRRWLADLGGEVVGAAELLEPLGSRTPGAYWLELAVRPAWRGQGVAGALAGVVQAELASLAPTRLKVVVSEANPVALRFAGKHGFAEAERYWDRTLALGGFDAARFARPLPEGVKVVTLAEFSAQGPDVTLALSTLYAEAMADLPRLPGEPSTPLPPDAFQGWLAHLDPALVLLALRSGVPVGFTALEPSGARGPVGGGLLTDRPGPPHDPERYELVIAMTGVARAERRQGLAQALKLASMAAAAQAGWAVIRTTNHGRNLGMLQVNDALGFGREPARLGMVRTWPN